MSDAVKLRKQLFRKTKVQLIDKIDALEKRLALIELATQDIFFDHDLKTDVFSFTIEGRERLELLEFDGTGKDWLKRLHPDDREAHRAAYLAAVKGEREQYFLEIRLKDDDDGWLWLQMRGVCQRGQDGKAIRFIGYAADVTRRKQTEEQLLQAKQQSEAASKLVAEKCLTSALMSQI